MAQTEISAKKIAAYRATDYRFGEGADAITLRIDEASLALESLYVRLAHTRGVFITAFNPYGEVHGDEANEAAHLRLGRELKGLHARAPEKLLAALGHEHSGDVEGHLAQLINARAQELPLPEGCAVIGGRNDALLIWEDPLTALAILAKCSDYVWLRAKTPAIHAALRRQMVTLLVPPQFAALIPEIQQHAISAAGAQAAVHDATVSAAEAIEPAEVEVSPAPKPHFMRRGGTGLNRR